MPKINLIVYMEDEIMGTKETLYDNWVDSYTTFPRLGEKFLNSIARNGIPINCCEFSIFYKGVNKLLPEDYDRKKPIFVVFATGIRCIFPEIRPVVTCRVAYNALAIKACGMLLQLLASNQGNAIFISGLPILFKPIPLRTDVQLSTKHITLIQEFSKNIPADFDLNNPIHKLDFLRTIFANSPELLTKVSFMPK